MRVSRTPKTLLSLVLTLSVSACAFVCAEIRTFPGAGVAVAHAHDLPANAPHDHHHDYAADEDLAALGLVPPVAPHTDGAPADEPASAEPAVPVRGHAQHEAAAGAMEVVVDAFIAAIAAAVIFFALSGADVRAAVRRLTQGMRAASLNEHPPSTPLAVGLSAIRR